MFKKILIVSALTLSSSMVSANQFMDSKWALATCDAWNLNETLMTKLAGDAWMNNDKDRGYKIIQMYRTDCGAATKIQLNIEDKDGKASCTYGGVPDGKKLNPSVDYVMHATDVRWTELGKGEYGPAKAMMFGRLKFTGPKVEAMSVMSPFGEFLKLAGSVAGEKGKDNCPPAAKAPDAK